MGTGTPSRDTEKQVTKQPRCSLCGTIPTPYCTWKQGRCPHIPSLLDTIMDNPYKSRFYRLIKSIFKNK